MGTRSLTAFKDGNQEICRVYQQFDGYPSGVGAELAAILAPISIVNGISDRSAAIANGMGCLAAQVIATIKTEPGGVYLYPPHTENVGEEYLYVIEERDGRPHMTVYAGEMTFFGFAAPEGQRPHDNKPIWAGFAAEFDAEAAEANA